MSQSKEQAYVLALYPDAREVKGHYITTITVDEDGLPQKDKLWIPDRIKIDSIKATFKTWDVAASTESFKEYKESLDNLINLGIKVDLDHNKKQITITEKVFRYTKEYTHQDLEFQQEVANYANTLIPVLRSLKETIG